MTLIYRRIAALSCASALGFAALAGCSSSTASTNAAATGAASGSAAASSAASTSTGGTSNAGLTDKALRTAFAAAASGGTAVHMKGAVTQSGQTVTMDVQLNKDDSSDGMLTLGAAQLPIKAVGGVYYLEFTSSFIEYTSKQQGSSAAAMNMLENKWVSSNSAVGKSLAQSFSQFMSYSEMIKQVSDNSDDDTVTAAGTTTLNGQSVAVYNSTKGSKLYFAASGPAYMLQQVFGGTDGTGTVTYTWNQPTTVTPPPASQVYSG